MHCLGSRAELLRYNITFCQVIHNIKKQSYSGCFLYFQIYHQALSYQYLQQDHILVLSIQVSLAASAIAQKLLISSHSNEYCSTGLELGCNAQNLQVQVLLTLQPSTLYLCFKFSLRVHHSKLSTVLFFLLPSLWFI